MGSVLDVVNTIQILMEREENEEVLALYGGGTYVLSQEYKNWYAPIWRSWTPERRKWHISKFRAAAPPLEQTFVKPVNAGRKPGHQLRMRPQNDLSVIFDRIRSAPTKSPTLMASLVSPSSPSVSIPASSKTATVSLNSQVISTLASSQVNSSQWISFEDPCRGRETISELHLMSELPKMIRRCHGNCHKTITQSNRLLVRSYGISSCPDAKTGEERSSHGSLYIYFQDKCHKAYDSNNFYAPN